MWLKVMPTRRFGHPAQATDAEPRPVLRVAGRTEPDLEPGPNIPRTGRRRRVGNIDYQQVDLSRPPEARSHRMSWISRRHRVHVRATGRPRTSALAPIVAQQPAFSWVIRRQPAVVLPLRPGVKGSWSLG